MHPSSPAKDLTFGQRISTQTVCPVNTRRHFANGIESINVCFTPLVDGIPAHHMMHGRRDLHHLFAHIDTYFHMRSKHIGNEFFSFSFLPVGDIQVDSSMFCASTFLNFLVNRSRYFVPSSKLEALGLVTLHEALSQAVFENTTVPLTFSVTSVPRFSGGKAIPVG